MRALRRLVLPLLVVALLAWGYAYDAPAEPRPYLSGLEVSWVRTFEEWLMQVQDLADEARTSSPTDPVEWLGDCDELELRVGTPPSDRLEPTIRRARTACGQLAAFADARTADPAEADRHWQRARDILFEADDGVYELFGYSGSLPRSEGTTAESHVDPRLSAVAGAWVGFPVEVRCFGPSDWRAALAENDAWYGDYPEDASGFADTEQDRIALGPATCNVLKQLRRGARAPAPGHPGWLDLAEGVATLAHEIAHLDDSGADESETECAAVQRVEWTAQQLGAPVSYARRLAVSFWQDSYPQNDNEYFTDDCREGGPLDEHPSSGRWP